MIFIDQGEEGGWQDVFFFGQRGILAGGGFWLEGVLSGGGFCPVPHFFIPEKLNCSGEFAYTADYDATRSECTGASLRATLPANCAIAPPKASGWVKKW